MWSIRETKGRVAQVEELGRRTGLDGFASVIDFALAFALSHTPGSIASVDEVRELAEQVRQGQGHGNQEPTVRPTSD